VSATFLGSPGTGNLRGDEPFPQAARAALADSQLRRNIGHATRSIRTKRLNAVVECADWEQLRAAGSAIKQDAMARLPELLEELERNVTARGGVVHWARDADEANRIVTELIRATGADEVVKVKSMATQEIGLNEYLEARGIAAFETDLAELIVQLGHDKPSHILVPAIHRNRAEIREIFDREMPDVGELTDEPEEVLMAEFIREAALEGVRDELPHSLAVVIEEVDERPGRPEDQPLIDVHAILYVERDSQKGIVIGKGGARLREVGTVARSQIEKLLGTKVYLDLRVKIAKNW